MSNNEYSEMGKDMKRMKDQRVRGMASIRNDRRERSGQVDGILDQGRRLVADATRTLQATSKANGQLAAQTRRSLADARTELNGMARQTKATVDATRTHVREQVSALKADAARIVAGAGQFLADTHQGNADLRDSAHQIVADAAATIGRFAAASHQRAAGWREIVRVVRGGGPSAAPAEKAAPRRGPARGRKGPGKGQRG